MKRRILILNGPGLAELGVNAGSSYGGVTLRAIRAACSALCRDLGVGLEFRQTDDPEEMFRWLTGDSEGFDSVIINPGDSSKADSVSVSIPRSVFELAAELKKPVVEVHIDNIFTRHAEIAQREHGPVGGAGLICGLGIDSYMLAIRAVVHRFETNAVAA